jgi:hypothetical protein
MKPKRGEQIMSAKTSRNHSRINPLRLLASLLVTGLSVAPLLGQSVPFPTYTVGPQTNGTFVVSDGTIITPTGTQVNLGIRVRAKAIALNPTGNHTAAVLTMGTSPSNGNGTVEVFNTQTGAIVQTYTPAAGTDPDGSNLGITYTPDGKYLLFSQDGNSFYPQAGRLRWHRHRRFDGQTHRLRPCQRSNGRQRGSWSNHRHLLSEQPGRNQRQLPDPVRLLHIGFLR